MEDQEGVFRVNRDRKVGRPFSLESGYSESLAAFPRVPMAISLSVLTLSNERKSGSPPFFTENLP